MKYSLIFSLIIAFGFTSNGQINAYAKVSGLTGTTLTITNVNQSFHTFAVGEYAVIMQMQDDVIGANTADNINFGDLANIESAGLYEIQQIISIDGNASLGYSTATPSTIVLNNINNTYHVNPNSSLQLISFRKMSNGNYTTTANITALNWDGNIGGVIAFEVPGILTLNHNISANGSGFRGGNASNNDFGVVCQSTPFLSDDTNLGFKGEGVYKSTNTTYNNARAKIINGGGGGLAHNGGGGGGGNFTSGGDGGVGWNCSNPSVGFGYGGLALSPYAGGTRIFMGGGGGGGQQNNGAGTNGGNGGGIILIKANEIQTTGSCAGHIISANGFTSLSSVADGSGGGGAAGSIVLEINIWSINTNCNLSIQANGGSGGSVNFNENHGAGGAGGQGLIVFNGLIPTSNVSITTLNGSAGCNNNSNPCTSFAGNASGNDNIGILAITNNPLPIELISFNVNLLENRWVELSWQTASEMNNDYFTIERSSNGIDWTAINEIDGAGNSFALLNYSCKDLNPLNGISYYRLKQTDFDGSDNYSSIRSVKIDLINASEISVYPNPTEKELFIAGKISNVQDYIIYDVLGNDVSDLVEITIQNENLLTINVTQLSKGIYLVKTKTHVVNVIIK